MVRDRGDGRRGSIAIKDGMVPEEARRAITHVRPVQCFVTKTSGDAPHAYTVVECKLRLVELTKFASICQKLAT